MALTLAKEGEQVSSLLALMGRALVALVSLLYLLTSAVVTINGFVWLPGLPASWYAMEAALYWPLRPYFDLTFSLMGRWDMPYGIYALLSRAPVLGLSFLGLWFSLRPRKTRSVP